MTDDEFDGIRGLIQLQMFDGGPSDPMQEIRDHIESQYVGLEAENAKLRALLAEASGHVAPDTCWSYDEPTGYLLDRIDAAMAQGKV